MGDGRLHNTAIKDCRRVVLARKLVSSYVRKAQNVWSKCHNTKSTL